MQTKNIGKVVQLKDGVILSSGLSDVGYNQLVNIKVGNDEIVKGLALSLEKDKVGILALGNTEKIKQGNLIEATNESLSIKINDNFLGRSVDALGNPIDGKGDIKELQNIKAQKIDKIAPGVIDRKDVKRPLQTGIKAIDSMIPIGRGQRELIIGDRQTGKTAIAIDTIINQQNSKKELGLPLVKCIYVAIGQKTSKIRQIAEKLKQTNALDYTVIVSASASDPASMQYLAPLTGTAIGEYFAEKGEDALIIYDDLTKHAWAYREISLLLKRPPGREAYPGDIFYLHSSLLERAVQFSDKKGGGSLTALPIIETQAGDVSAYIPTNVISITDGQIYLEQDLFNSSIRPAVNVGISVSRVGGDAQFKEMKQVAGQLRLDLAQYRELAAFAQFGSDLDEQTKQKLMRGERMVEILKQEEYSPKLVGDQIALIYAGTKGFLDKIPTEKIQTWENQFIEFLHNKHMKLLQSLANDNKISDSIEEELKNTINKFNQEFASNAN